MTPASKLDVVGVHDNSSRIFIVMLHLHGTPEDIKIWAKIISAHAKKCSKMMVSVAVGWGGGEVSGAKREL